MKYIKKPIIIIINNLIKTFNKPGEYIAQGRCGEFADKLIKELGGETEDTFILSTCTMFGGEDCMDYKDPNNKRYYKKFGNLPEDITPGKLQWVDHAWIYYKGMHYDSWTTEGVNNFINLDWFKKNLKDIKEMEDEPILF